MKILFIVDYYYPYIGGSEVLHQKLAEHLAQKHQVTVLTQSLSKQKEIENIGGIEVVRFPVWHRFTFPWQAKKVALTLAKNSDYIYASTYSSGFMGAWLKRKLGKPVTFLVHGYLREAWYKIGLSRLIAWGCYRYEELLFRKKFDQYVVPSQFTYNKLLQLDIDREKIAVIAHGIDTALFHPMGRNDELRTKLGFSPAEKIFLFSGRPSRMKGIEYLLEAAKKQRGPFRLVLMLAHQPYDEYARVIKFIGDNKLSELVVVIEPVSHQEMPEYLAIADVVVIPSLTEEFCFLAAETAAMQIPMIVSNVGALPEVVSGKVLFVAPADASQLHKAIELALEERFDSLPTKTFSWDSTLQKYEELYTKSVIDLPQSS